MQSSKLVEVLRTFSAKDLRRFDEFVRSPFFNKHDGLVRFYQELKRAAPAFTGAKVDRYYVWEKLFPGEPYEDKQLSYLMSGLLKLAESFLGLSRYEEETVLPAYHTLHELSQRHLDKHYRHFRSQTEKRLRKQAFRNSDYYFEEYLLAQVEAIFFQKKRERTHDDSIAASIKALDRYYLADKLKLSCELINRQNILASAYDQAEIERLKAYVEGFPMAESPAVTVYFQVLLILTEPEVDAHYQQLIAQVGAFSSSFPVSELRELYQYAQNYCISRVRKGEPAYLAELFQLYKVLIEGELILEDGLLSPWTYKNIVSVALRLQEFAWAESFIQDFQEFLEPAFRETALAYNLANLHYHRGAFDKALRSLQTVEFSDLFYSLDTRKMMVKIYYEQEDTEPLLSLLAAFRIYLKRNKLMSEVNREAYLNFVHLVGVLQKCREGKVRVEAVEEGIAERGAVVEKEWLGAAVAGLR